MADRFLAMRVRRSVLNLKLKRATSHKRELQRRLKKATNDLMAAELRAAKQEADR